jgi:hypothetical protein
VPKRPKKLIPHPTDAGIFLLPLTKGYFALVDAVDAEDVGRRNWCASVKSDGRVYARCAERNEAGRQTSLLLHRYIGKKMKLAACLDVDHRDGNGLNCRRYNLREADDCQNAQNTKTFRTNSSGVKGVSFNKATGKWDARVSAHRVAHFIGSFDSLELAAPAVEAARLRLHGEFVNHGAIH